jgi:hypothetical protein
VSDAAAIPVRIIVSKQTFCFNVCLGAVASG